MAIWVITDCIELTGSNLRVNELLAANCYNNGINILNSTSNVWVEDSEAMNDGLPLPSAGGAGIVLDPNSSSPSSIHLLRNTIHGTAFSTG